MSKKTILPILLYCGIVLLTFPIQAQKQLPAKEKTMEALKLTNKYFMEKWPDVGKRLITDRSRASNIWTRGVYYEGLMSLYQLDPQQPYLDYAIRWADFHQWNLRDGETYTRNADNQCAGQTYIDLYLIDPKPYKIEKIKASIDSMLHTSKIDDWTWVDAIQMAMPVYAKLGVIYGGGPYWERMYEMYRYACNKQETMDCSMLKTTYGGGIKILTLLTKSLTARIVTGPVEMAGYSRLWFVSWR